MKKVTLIMNIIGGLVLYTVGTIGAAETGLVYDLQGDWWGMLISLPLIIFGAVILALNLVWLVEPEKIETRQQRKGVMRKIKTH